VLHPPANHPSTKTVSISTAPGLMQRHGWCTEVLSLSELAQHLGQHIEISPRDEGPALVPGVLQGDQRLNERVTSLSAAVLNCNKGQPIREIVSKIEASGYHTYIYTTYDHLNTRTAVRVRALQAAYGPTVAVTADLVRRYLIEEKGYRPEIAEVVEIEEWVEGEFYAVHAPIPSCNVVLPLHEPFSRDTYGRSFGLSWKALLERLGDDLGLWWNRSCVGLAQGYALPACRPGAERVAIVVPGQLATMDKISGL